MRRSSGIFCAIGIALAISAVQTSCFFTVDLDDCSRYPSPMCFDGGVDGSSSSSSSSSSTGGHVNCDPTMGAVDAMCGVFVSASAAPGGDGTQATPYQTFAEAAAASPARVFACAGSYTETMQVSFSGGVEIYGGFTGCAKTWTWSASATAQISTVVDMPGIVLDGGTNKLKNVSVTAPAAMMAGGSSIALLVNGGSLDMTNGSLTAGNAKDGAAGTSPPTTDTTLDGADGALGTDACGPGITHPGAMGATNMCATGGSSTAGNGGDGGQIVNNMLQPAGNGADGSAMPPETAVGVDDGKGGAGEGQPSAPVCVPGDTGASGGAGTSGAGAAGAGAITASGYQGVAGTVGTNGKAGQGGGGGGGAEGGLSVSCGADAGTIAVLGASGGAGGTGGCGGALGGGGQPGGSSIALLALDATVTATNVTLTASKGGNGGQGGSGQNGGSGGGGGAKGNGVGSNPPAACAGGSGGAGGNGGPGGGGQGGHSLGIAFQGTKAPTGGKFVIDMTKNGTGGLGGANSTAANMGKGTDGFAVPCWDFGKNVACGM